MKAQRCRQHQSSADRICTFSGCSDRRMCMLCDHGHVFLANMRQILWLDYKKFRGKVEAAIDTILGENTLPESRQDVRQQIDSMNQYFESAYQFIKKLLEERRQAVMQELTAVDDDNVARLRSLRITGGYFQAPQDLFEVLLLLNEGGTLQQDYAAKSAQRSMKAQQKLNEASEAIQSFLTALSKDKRKAELEVPDLSSSSAGSRIRTNQHRESDNQFGSRASEAHQMRQSRIVFQSVISSAVEHSQRIFTTCYDKKLRVVSRDLDLLKEVEFNNTLQRICSLSDKQLAVAVSRELHILNIAQDEQLEIKTLMKLRGHEGKIVALDKLNTRIVGSCSAEGLKVWDLYKQKDQYSLRKNQGLVDMKFVSGAKRLALGALDWSYRYYDVESMKMLKTYRLNGIPLTSYSIDDNIMLVGGFPHTLSVIDSRIPNPIFTEVDGDGITCMDMAGTLITGSRSGSVSIVDLRRKQVQLSWQAHQGTTSWNKPNGVAAVFSSDRSVTTVGANDRKLKRWNVM